MAAVAAFVGSLVCYIVFGQELTKVSPVFAAQQPSGWKMLVVFAGSLVLTIVVTYILARTDTVTWTSAVGIGFLLWLGLSAVQWVNSMVCENVPLKMAAIDAGDWLLKLIIISAIIGLWR